MQPRQDGRIECEGEPKQDVIFVRNNKPREGV